MEKKNKRNIGKDIEGLAKDLQDTVESSVEIKKMKGKSLTWDTEKEAYYKAIFDDYYAKNDVILNFSQTILVVFKEYCEIKGIKVKDI